MSDLERALARAQEVVAAFVVACIGGGIGALFGKSFTEVFFWASVGWAVASGLGAIGAASKLRRQ